MYFIFKSKLTEAMSGNARASASVTTFLADVLIINYRRMNQLTTQSIKVNTQSVSLFKNPA